MSNEDFAKARKALVDANVPEPYIAIVDPKYIEEDVIEILVR